MEITQVTLNLEIHDPEQNNDELLVGLIEGFYL